jgi:hypothetical protein
VGQAISAAQNSTNGANMLLLLLQDMEGACHCSVQPLAAGDSDEEELEQQQQQQVCVCCEPCKPVLQLHASSSSALHEVNSDCI